MSRSRVPCSRLDRALSSFEVGIRHEYAGSWVGCQQESAGNSLPLAPHMTFSDEPGIYLRGEFGVRLEDDMHITESGAELFTPQSPSLEHPFGVG